MKRYLLLTLFSSSLLVYGQQNVTFDRKNFKDNIKGYNQAMDSIQVGQTFYQMGQNRYYMAIPYFLSAEKFNPNNDQLNYLIGVCMLSRNSAFKAHSLSYLQKAFELNAAVTPDIHYQLGRAYHLNMAWDSAKQEYNAYLQTLNPNKNTQEIADVKKRIEECNNGQELVKHPTRVFIDNLGPNVNTQYSEYDALISIDESELIFTSVRPTNIGAKIDPIGGQYTEDLYSSSFKDGAWTPATNMGIPVNTDENDATAGISNDGQTLYIYRGTNGGDIYESHLKGSTWTEPVALNNKVNSPYQETSVSLGPDGKVLYFVSNRPGGYGDKDIYETVADDKGEWQEPINLGAVINTQYAEEGVFMQADGKTLYFSSKGHNTMGGYDIFKSVYDSGHWSNPANLGYPINTPGDDVFLAISASGKHGYYSSLRKDGYGGYDLYRITFLGPEKPAVQSNEDDLLAGSKSAVDNSPKTTLLKGIITDSATHKPLEASIEVVDNKKNVVISRFTSNSTTGKYLVSLPSGINYGITVKADGYLFYSDNFDIPDASSFKMVERNIALQPIGVGGRIALNNVFFDFNKATLRNESLSELNRLTNLMKTNSSLKVKISGFADNIGTEEYNQKLSLARAKAVVDYLVAHGISSDRLTYKGYGKDDPIAPNTTDAGRQLNRRTEFKIIGK